ncbi:hypothetical protein FPQ18DRAFT_307343 [Pyronema domesticum]|nr:hypothetical protein FPQ18DRAFT_307343 [Pyronema domesticum]
MSFSKLGKDGKHDVCVNIPSSSSETATSITASASSSSIDSVPHATPEKDKKNKFSLKKMAKSVIPYSRFDITEKDEFAGDVSTSSSGNATSTPKSTGSSWKDAASKKISYIGSRILPLRKEKGSSSKYSLSKTFKRVMSQILPGRTEKVNGKKSDRQNSSPEGLSPRVAAAASSQWSLFYGATVPSISVHIICIVKASEASPYDQQQNTEIKSAIEQYLQQLNPAAWGFLCDLALYKRNPQEAMSKLSWETIKKFNGILTIPPCTDITLEENVEEL